jgi:hypothetical protein
LAKSWRNLNTLFPLCIPALALPDIKCLKTIDSYTDKRISLVQL